MILIFLIIILFVAVCYIAYSWYGDSFTIKKKEYKVDYSQHPLLKDFEKPNVQSKPIETKPQYKITTFKIAGVTFKDGQKQRQTALRMLKFKDAPMDGPIMFEFEQYEYEGNDAVRIIANDRILGNVPADIVDEFIADITTHSDYDIDYHVSGGGDYPFGCEMTFTWN